MKPVYSGPLEAVLINNKLIISVLMLIIIALPLTAITVFATNTNSTHIKTNTTNTNITSKLNTIGQQEAQYKDVQGVSDVNSFTQLGYGDCWADSTWLYDKLTAAGIQARIMGYEDEGYGAGYRHAWVEINTGNGWTMWNYTGYNSQHYGDVGDGTPYVLIGPDNSTANIESTGY